MAKRLINNGLYVSPSTISGYGVFTDRVLRPGEIVEECRYIIITTPHIDFINYLFRFSDNLYALVLGYGSLYNHSSKPNLHYEFDHSSSLFILKANRMIQVGEELLVSYSQKWFDSRHIKSRSPFIYRFPFIGKSLLRFVTVLTLLLTVIYWPW